MVGVESERDGAKKSGTVADTSLAEVLTVEQRLRSVSFRYDLCGADLLCDVQSQTTRYRGVYNRD